MSLYVSGHYPPINGVNVPRNATIKVTFNTAFVTSSVNYRVISVHDQLYNSVPGTVSWDYTNQGTPSGICNILTFTPTILLDTNKEYSVYVHKEPDSVINRWNDQVQDTYKFSFITGSGTVQHTTPTSLEQLYIDRQHAIDIGDYEEAARIQNLIDQYEAGSLSGTIPVPQVVVDLNTVSTYPINEQANVEGLRFVKIDFNGAVFNSGISMSDYISLSYRNVLE